MICSHFITLHRPHFMIFMIFTDRICKNTGFLHFLYLNFMSRVRNKHNYNNLHNLSLLNSLLLSEIFDYLRGIMIFYFFIYTLEGILNILELDFKIKSEFHLSKNHLRIALVKFRTIL